ncbi:hypothetical protein WJX75_003381 [Coccomyxa subellipsoidea]|uniref:Uncharacterized protein n=1 Tax=Coccomyxa subellipsoidea TaxID=248742 RepID=A0ABR2YP67_9CHLO
MNGSAQRILPRSRQGENSGTAHGEVKAGEKRSKWKVQSAQLRLAMKASQGDSLAVAALTAEAHSVRSKLKVPICLSPITVFQV